MSNVVGVLFAGLTMCSGLGILSNLTNISIEKFEFTGNFCFYFQLNISAPIHMFVLLLLPIFISSTGRRPSSYCHGVVSVVRSSIRASVHKLFLQKTFPQKLLTGFLRNLTGMFLRWSSFIFL